jgi:hypothetical protein
MSTPYTKEMLMRGSVATRSFPTIAIRPVIPEGERLAAWAIQAFERARETVGLKAGCEREAAHWLSGERIHFVDCAAMQEIERSQRDPQGTLLYQICQNANTPVDYLDSMFMPFLSTLEGLSVYWNPLAEESALFVSREYLETAFSADNDDVRLYNALHFAENLTRVWLDMLPGVLTVPDQESVRVRECFRSGIRAELGAIEHRFPGDIDRKAMSKGFALVSELLDSEESRLSMQGARLSLRFAGRHPLAVEHELGRELQAGIISILSAKVRTALRDHADRAFLVRFKPSAAEERLVDTMQWQTMQILRELDLTSSAALGEAYAHSEVPLHYWAAASKKIDPWSYPN